jgi:outer membrane biosynthesis protein TonB
VPPRAKKSPPPNYPKEVRKKKIGGTVVLELMVGTDRIPQNIRAVRSLGYGLDEEMPSMPWRSGDFEPAKMNGNPVPLLVNIEVEFHP